MFINNDTRENVRNIKKLLKHEVFETFEERLKTELALLYINSFDKKIIKFKDILSSHA